MWDAAISEIQRFRTDECEVLIDSHTRYVKGLQHIDNPEHDNGSVTYQKAVYISLPEERENSGCCLRNTSLKKTKP